MNVVHSPKIQTSFKRFRKCFIWGILSIFVAIGFGIWAYMKDDAIALNTLIVENSEENTFAKVEVTSSPYAFAEYDHTTDKYYIVFDAEDLMYIVYLSEDTYNTLKNKATPENPIVIKGTTHFISSEVRNLAIDFYNKANEEEFLTEENFEKYLGNIYLDTTINNQNNTFQILFSVIFGILGLTLILIGFIIIKRSKKSISRFSDTEWKKIEDELERSDTISYQSLNLHFTENYIVSLTGGIDIFSYQDILWMYPYILKQYGITTSKNIVLVTNNKKRHMIANVSNFSKKSKEQYNDIMSFIHAKNPNCLVGYTKENIQEMKNLYGIK